nr:MAG TPA: H-type lectin domain [Caudoviricetes sp.]
MRELIDKTLLGEFLAGLKGLFATKDVATTEADGLMSAEDKKKLDSGGGGSSAPTLVPDVFELEDLSVQGGVFENAGEGWNTFTFPEPFDAPPLVLAQCDGYGVDVKGVTAERFLYMVTQATSSSGSSKTLYYGTSSAYRLKNILSTQKGAGTSGWTDGGSFTVLTSAGSSGTSGVSKKVAVRWAAIEKGGE